MTKQIALTTEEIEFLEQSNLIENVSDSDSFQQAAYAWDYLKSEEAISIDVILKTHKILMLHQPLRPNQRGYFRDQNVFVRRGNEIIRTFPEYSMVRFMIKGWTEQVKVPPTFPKDDRKSLLEYWIKKCHVDYESIHPFVDGNGRTGRMFLNWQRLKAGLPILVIKYEEREKYYKWF